MTSLVLLAWTAVTCLCWTSGSAQAPIEGTLYPALLSTVLLTCECHLEPCESVLWFRSLEDGDQLEFLVGVNSAERSFNNLNESRFRAGLKSSKLWTLRIQGVTQEDTGLYSCLLKNKKTEGLWKQGVLLLPGVTRPTPKPKPKLKEVVCGCRGKSQRPQSQGCGSSVLWPMVGILAGLVVALLSTLYYFSRLPKKCRHHFVKKGQMRRT